MSTHQMRRGTAWTVLLAFFTSLAACGGGEQTAPPPTTLVVPTTVVPTTAPPPTLPAQAPDQLSKEQLRELVAPVALYPDVVLASLLPATTYPEQVADAARWVAQQQGQVQTIPEDRNWDGSVAGLLQFPDVLNWLDQNDPWEEQMGTAMTYQQGDVLQAIQDYRKLALDAGNLESNQYQKITTAPNQEILIAPAQPDTVYVPQYDTAAVTQPQATTGINPWLAFGGGAAVGALGAWALYSIFDDDDGGGGNYHKKSVKTYNNYYYGGSGQRPAGGDWNARPRPGRPGRPGGGQVARPRPVAPVYTSKPATRPAGDQGGLRPPQKRPGQQGPGGAQQAHPTPAPAIATPAKEGKKAGGGQGQGGGQKQGDKRPQEKRAPTPGTPEGFQSQPKPKPQTKQQQQPQQKKQQQQNPQKKQTNQPNKKKKKELKGGGAN
jgi:hypothetical protein